MEDEDDMPVLNTCNAIAAVGGLSYDASTGFYSYKTSGGGNIVLEPRQFKIRHDSYPNFILEFWGDTTVNGKKTTSANHENLNGKHLKDRVGSRRTIVFPDGAKITWVTDGEKGPVLSVSIYDGAQAHHINITCGKLEYSGINQVIAKKLEEMQADGETSSFEISSTGVKYFNIYTEDSPGVKANKRVELGELFKALPTNVTDYYDDPRLAST